MALFTCTSEVLRQGRSSQNLAWCGTHIGRWGGRPVTGQHHLCGYVATVGTFLPWAHHPHGHITLWALQPLADHPMETSSPDRQSPQDNVIHKGPGQGAGKEDQERCPSTVVSRSRHGPNWCTGSWVKLCPFQVSLKISLGVLHAAPQLPLT